MGNIYSKAMRVVVWLGETAIDSDLAIRALAWIGEEIELHESGNVLFNAKSESDIFLIENTSDAWRAYILEWLAIRNVLNRA